MEFFSSGKQFHLSSKSVIGRGLYRPFLMQSDLSVENGLFRLNEAQIGLSYAVEKLSRKSFTCVFLTDRIAHPTTKHTPTRPHGHTPIHTKYHTAVSYKALTLTWLSQLLLLAASQRGAFLVLLANSVYHTTAAARGLDPMLPTTAAAAVALAVFG